MNKLAAHELVLENQALLVWEHNELVFGKVRLLVAIKNMLPRLLLQNSPSRCTKAGTESH